MHRFSPSCVAAVLVAAALAAVTARPARAQSPDARAMAVAQTLHEQAVVALDAKDYATACPKLEQVVRLLPAGLGAQLSLAECSEGQGRLATAWATYLLVEAAAAQTHHADRQQAAHAHAAALKPRLSRLTIAVSEVAREAMGIEVRCDGRVVPPGEWGVPLPVDGGAHVIVATARGKQRWERDVDVRAEGASVTVSLDALADAVGPAGSGLGPVAPPPVGAPAGASAWSVPRVAGIAVGAAGVVALGVGVGFGLHAISTKSASDAHCNAADRCDAMGIDLRASSLSAGNWSTAMFLVGAAAVAGGVVLFVTAPPGPARVAVGPRGLALHGAW